MAAKAAGDEPLSQAIKIIMNSFYGVLGTPGCRFFDAQAWPALLPAVGTIFSDPHPGLHRRGGPPGDLWRYRFRVRVDTGRA